MCTMNSSDFSLLPINQRWSRAYPGLTLERNLQQGITGLCSHWHKGEPGCWGGAGMTSQHIVLILHTSMEREGFSCWISLQPLSLTRTCISLLWFSLKSERSGGYCHVSVMIPMGSPTKVHRNKAFLRLPDRSPFIRTVLPWPPAQKKGKSVLSVTKEKMLDFV